MDGDELNPLSGHDLGVVQPHVAQLGRSRRPLRSRLDGTASDRAVAPETLLREILHGPGDVDLPHLQKDGLGTRPARHMIASENGLTTPLLTDIHPIRPTQESRELAPSRVIRGHGDLRIPLHSASFAHE